MIAEVILNSNAKQLNRVFDYEIPSELAPEIKLGARVLVPFSNRKELEEGFVVNIKEKSDYKVKSIVNINANYLDEKSISLARWMAERYFCNVSDCIKLMLPPGTTTKILENRVKEKNANFVYLKKSVEDIEQDIQNKKVKSEKQIRALEFLINNEGVIISDLETFADVSKAVLNTLLKNGYIEIVEKQIERNPFVNKDIKKDSSFVLNEEQQKAYNAVSDAIEDNFNSEFLLFGVTGSGKTEVYLQLIEKVLNEGKTSLMLVPEIALTPQTVDRFIARFGEDNIAVLHSKLSMGERYDQWNKIKKDEAKIVIGARSAIFAPIQNLGLIIMDEEHDQSYKSETTPKYHARDVAIERARQSGASVVLGSATPSVESYEKAKTGEYTLLTLPHRVNHVSMPKVYVADLRKELEEGNRSIFSRVLQEKIEERLKRGEQTILFLNRRGYAGFVSCRSCGFVLKCSHCEVSMTAHKNHVGDVDTLVCHYCGHAIAMPKTCPSCGSPYIAAFGLGTQKVEEMLNKRFPTARVLRMDGDTTTGKHGHESVLTPFRNGEADILIGTQMIVKGHDFPNVTLVAALAADMSLYAGDYRSSERTFELLMQASGRAGRAEKAGEVVIQTYNPEEYSIQAVAGQDAEYFYENELAFRRLMKYPPYSQMAAILILSEEENEAKILSEKLAENIHSVCGDAVTLIGPSKAGLSRAKDRYRYVLYVKSMDEEAMACVREIAEEANRRVVNQKTCSVQYDRDPVNGY